MKNIITLLTIVFLFSCSNTNKNGIKSILDEKVILQKLKFKEYQRNYARKRYNENEDARKKQLERTNKYNKENEQTKKEREKLYYQQHKEEIKLKNKELRENSKKYLKIKDLV